MLLVSEKQVGPLLIDNPRLVVVVVTEDAALLFVVTTVVVLFDVEGGRVTRLTSGGPLGE
jgi:hypothetical protein